MLYAIRKIGDKAAHEPLTACRFVPFVGA